MNDPELVLIIGFVVFFVLLALASSSDSKHHWKITEIYNSYTSGEMQSTIDSLYASQEYETTIRKSGEDGYIDVVAEKPSYTIAVVYIERDPDNPRSVVGKDNIHKARDSATTVGADSVHVITSGSFSENAQRESSNGSMATKLISGDQLVKKLNEHDVPAP